MTNNTIGARTVSRFLHLNTKYNLLTILKELDQKGITLAQIAKAQTRCRKWIGGYTYRHLAACLRLIFTLNEKGVKKR